MNIIMSHIANLLVTRHIKLTRNRLVISAITSSISLPSSSPSSIWCTILNAKIFFGCTFHSCYSMVISCVIKELMSFFNESFVRSLAYWIVVTLAYLSLWQWPENFAYDIDINLLQSLITHYICLTVLHLNI
jgi:hypothetical protein